MLPGGRDRLACFQHAGRGPPPTRSAFTRQAEMGLPRKTYELPSLLEHGDDPRMYIQLVHMYLPTYIHTYFVHAYPYIGRYDEQCPNPRPGPTEARTDLAASSSSSPPSSSSRSTTRASQPSAGRTCLRASMRDETLRPSLANQRSRTPLRRPSPRHGALRRHTNAVTQGTSAARCCTASGAVCLSPPKRAARVDSDLLRLPYRARSTEPRPNVERID